MGHTISQPKHKCGVCDRGFDSKYSLKRHQSFMGHEPAARCPDPVAFGGDEARCNLCGMIWDRYERRPECPRNR